MSLNLDELKEFIRNKLLDENGYFYGRKIRKSWFIRNNCVVVYNQIIENTSFLKDKEPIGERIYCILNDISVKKLCYCKEYLFYHGFIHGYLKTCGKKECRHKYESEMMPSGLTRQQEFFKKNNEIKRNTINEDGLNIHQVTGRKSRDTLRLRYGDDYFKKFALRSCEKLRNDIDENGLDGLQRRKIKCEQTKLNDVVDGLNLNKRGALKAAATMKKVQEDGMTQYQKNAIAVTKTKINNIDEDGNNSFTRTAIASANTKRIKIDKETGKTISEIQVEKMMKTRLNNIDESGFNGFERSFVNGAGKSIRKFYKESKISYQGGNEEDFLDKLVEFDMFKNLIKTSPITYISIDNKEHYYHPDFLMFDKVYFEIKCKWTYDGNDKDLLGRYKNNLKWKFLLQTVENSKLFIIWDMNYIQQVFLKDFETIENFYQKEKFIEFTKENLLNLLKQ
jgi:hypothetical protein